MLPSSLAQGFEHALRIVFVIDFGENPAVSVVDEKNDHLQLFPLPGISQSCPSRRRVDSIAWASVRECHLSRDAHGSVQEYDIADVRPVFGKEAE
jgi:hypothetical protein